MFWIGLFEDPTEVRGSGGDLNLISLYGISVEMTSEDEEGRVTAITIDATGTKKPERYPLSVADVVTATEKAVRIEFPDETRTRIIMKGRSTAAKDLGEGGTGEPAARPESKSVDGDHPQPESEGRSR